MTETTLQHKSTGILWQPLTSPLSLELFNDNVQSYLIPLYSPVRKTFRVGIAHPDEVMGCCQ